MRGYIDRKAGGFVAYIVAVFTQRDETDRCAKAQLPAQAYVGHHACDLHEHHQDFRAMSSVSRYTIIYIMYERGNL